MLFYHILPLVFALLGFFSAFYIFYKKRQQDGKLVCIFGSDCTAVVESKYSKIFGVRLESLGMLYYIAVFGFFAVWLFDKNMLDYFQFVFLITSFGFIFSIYLTYLQAFVLKNWCTYCLVSALSNMVIFFTEVKIFFILLF